VETPDPAYDGSAFEADLPFLESLPLVNRTGSAAVNAPMIGADYAFIPYCTGDLGAGDNVASLGSGSAARTVHFTGASNVATFAAVLHASFAGVTRVWLVGTDAGGYGATFALPAFVAAWPGAEVHVLQDSALFLTPMANYATMQAAWQPAFPAGCTACSTSLPAVIDTLTASFPASRIGLMTWSEDPTAKALLGYSGSIAPDVTTLLADQYGKPETAGFELAGSNHTMLFDEQTLVGSGGVVLTTWVDEWATGSAAWATVQ